MGAQSKQVQVRENVSDQAAIGFSFESDWFKDGGTSLLDQPQSIVKQNQCNPGLLLTLHN